MFIRKRTINGKQYSSREWRWREGGKVRSRSQAISRSFDDNRSLHGGSTEVEDSMRQPDLEAPAPAEAVGHDKSGEAEQDTGAGDKDGEADL